MMTLRQAVWMQQFWCWLGAGPGRKMMEKGRRKHQGWGRWQQKTKTKSWREPAALLVFWNFKPHTSTSKARRGRKKEEIIYIIIQTQDQSQMFNFIWKSACNQTSLVLHPLAANNESLSTFTHLQHGTKPKKTRSPTHFLLVTTRYFLILTCQE